MSNERSERTALWQPWSLRELVTELSTGAVEPDDVMHRCRTRIADTEPEIAAWVAVGDAPADGPGGILAGVPMGVKDIIDVAGYPTRCGSALRADRPPAERDSAIVSRWRRTGAVPVGKTVTTEFAFFAPGPTRNPAAPAHTPGGSSSGSAAAVASGQVPLAIGSQTAGSVTRPASFCGVAALVMTPHRYPTDGVVGLSRSLDAHGVFTATASDLGLGWSALSGASEIVREDRRPPRMLAWTGAPLGVVEDETTELMAQACEIWRAAGASIDPLPEENLLAQVTTAHGVIMAYEAARERAAEAATPDRLSSHLAALLERGAHTSTADYAAATTLVQRAGEHIARVLANYDAILGPAAPGPAPAGLHATGDPVLSRAGQALGLPAVAVPGIRTRAGLPLGYQVLGRPYGESALIAVARWLERVYTGAIKR